MAIPRENFEYAEMQRLVHEKEKILREQIRRMEIEQFPPVGGISPPNQWWSYGESRMGVAGMAGAVGQAIVTQQVYVDPRIEIYEKEIAGLKAALAERDEIIEALIVDMGNIDALKEEAECLRIELAARPEKPIPISVIGDVPGQDEWTAWNGSEVNPVPGRIIQYKMNYESPFDGKAIAGPIPSEALRWGWLYRGCNSDVTAYRIVHDQ